MRYTAASSVCRYLIISTRVRMGTPVPTVLNTITTNTYLSI